MSSSSIKSLIKDLLPPIVLKSLKKSMTQSKCYNSYDEAMNDTDGYENEALVKVIVAKGKRFAESVARNKKLDLMSLRTFVGLSSTLNGKKFTVIDFGGAAGTHFFIAKSILSKNILIDWRIVKTTAMVNEAKNKA